MPAPEDLAATKTSYLEAFLTATDSRGLSRTVSRKIYPTLVDVTFRTDPTELKLKVNGVTVTAPRTITSWKGYKLDANASTQTTPSGRDGDLPQLVGRRRGCTHHRDAYFAYHLHCAF
jgi:hypothetical protein